MANKNRSININPMDFPNHKTPDKEKAGEDYGLKVAKAIQYEWFNKNDGACRYYSQQSDFYRLRLYARGEQSVKPYKEKLSINGSTEQLNLDWKPLPVVPKFVDIMVNGMNDRLFTPKAYAEDITSSEDSREKRADESCRL